MQHLYPKTEFLRLSYTNDEPDPTVLPSTRCDRCRQASAFLIFRVTHLLSQILVVLSIFGIAYVVFEAFAQSVECRDAFDTDGNAAQLFSGM
jgi:hypothetical protein